jgi:NlpC/P60 family protein
MKRVRSLAISALLLFAPTAALAQRALQKENLVDYIRGRDDLAVKERRAWEKELRKRFGGAALKEEGEAEVEIAVAKAIVSSAIFMRIEPARAAEAAFEGYRGALGYVPPPIAIHYQVLAFQGRQPRGRPIDLAFHFPEYYNEEIAPDLVAYWEEALGKGRIPDDALHETKEALEETRVRMRPLLLDKLRLLARLQREIDVARGSRKAEIQKDMRDIDAELQRSFKNVPRRPEAIDPRKRPYDRLRIQIEDMGLSLSEEDRHLDPDAAPPPRRPIPTPPPGDRAVGTPGEPLLEEPTEVPSGPLPPQPRAGDPDPRLDKQAGRSLGELTEAYRRRLESTIAPWLGTPYLWGTATPKVGTDCSGFTRGVYIDGFSIELPRVSRDQYRVGRSVSVEALRPGDLVFFDTADMGRITHVGVYEGDGRFAHAAAMKGVSYAKLDDKYYRRAYRGARRLLVYPE